MTSFARSIRLAAGITVLAGAQTVGAKVTEPVEFTTSFPFTVGNATVPAGRYTIRPDEDNPAIFELTGGRTSVLFQAENASARETPAKTEVVFKRYGNGYVLKNIWIEGSTSGAEAIAVEGERRATKARGLTGEQRVAGRKQSAAAAKNR